MNNKFKIFLTGSFFVVTLFAFAQKDYYKLGRYRIYPEQRYVMIEEATGGTYYDEEGNVTGHWDGSAYNIDPRINYDNTTLYFIGNIIIFKEYLNPQINMNSLKVFKSGFDEYYSDLICVDSRRVYDDIFKLDENEDEDEEDIDEDQRLSGKKYLGNRLYKDKTGQLYVFDNYQYRLEKIAKDSSLDWATLKYVYDQYFYDKNGLYQIGAYNVDDCPLLLEKSNGQTIVPVVKDNYLIYGSNVYSKEQRTKKLNLMPDKIKRFDVYYDGDFLTDGSTSYYKDKEIEREEFKQTGNWTQIGAYGSFSLIVDDKDSTLCFPNEKSNINFQKQSNLCLIHDKDQYLQINTDNGLIPREWKIYKYKDVRIFNYLTKEYESLDISQYRFIGDELYVYKGILYSHRCCPVFERDEIDVENFAPFYYKDKKTKYYTDGKILLYHKDSGYTSTSDEYPEVCYREKIVKNIDIKTLKAISEDILIDKNNIYNGSYNGIETIPIKKIGLRIIMYTED